MAGLILNSPHAAPGEHWRFVEDGQPLARVTGRRKAGYTVATPGAKPHQDRGIFIEIAAVNAIRPRVDKWRADGYPGVSGISKALLAHWHDAAQREFPFFFCQLEAMETLIWMAEAAESERAGIDIGGDGGAFARLCCKLATGTGKTVVMAMLIAWQVINKAAYPQDARFSKNIFIVAPGLTVRNRLGVLDFAAQKNYYDEFRIVPDSLREKLRQGRVMVRNWHALNWLSDEKIRAKKGVDKRGAKSDEAYAREVLAEMSRARNIIVINDEAHHAWRVNEESPQKGRAAVAKDAREEATVWVGGLDRLHRARKILQCYDFSATPFAPSGKRNYEESLFDWIVSDFGLNDAIESGLVKTPRVVVDDDAVPDARTYKPVLYHIYNKTEVKTDLNRRAKPHEGLPSLVSNAYALLGADWQKTKEEWAKRGAPTPPVMITVANRTETAARIKHAFDNHRIEVDALCDSAGILHIDSEALKKAEQGDSQQPATKKEQADILREKVNTVGQEGSPGAPVQNVISVGMLSEGWDARTVTHIMGLRAFSSQLLCEQVIGRGLRRASYELNAEGKFDPEYVNVFGVPFHFLPHEEEGGGGGEVNPKITIRPDENKKEFAIQWPNVVRIERAYRARLHVNWEEVTPLQLDTTDMVQIAKIAPVVDGNADVSKIKDVDLESLVQNRRMQTMIFRAAQSVYREMQPQWKASAAVLMAQLVCLAEQFIASDRIEIQPALFNRDARRRQIVIMLGLEKVIRHFWHAITFENTEQLQLVFDDARCIRASGDMRPWKTGKPCAAAEKSHINRCTFDSAWEASEAFHLAQSGLVEAWVKNDHLGFDILYVDAGAVKKYRPDFLIRLACGRMLVLEVKGKQRETDDAKHVYMREWVDAVNTDGRFGRWSFAVSRAPADVADILAAHARAAA